MVEVGELAGEPRLTCPARSSLAERDSLDVCFCLLTFPATDTTNTSRARIPDDILSESADYLQSFQHATGSRRRSNQNSHEASKSLKPTESLRAKRLWRPANGPYNMLSQA